jgi:hypothetical protein
MFPDRRRAHQERMQAEHKRSHEHLRRYHEKNPGVLDDAETYLQAHGLSTDAQLEDLERAGLYDPEGFRKLSGGRGPTASEIHDKHLEARAHNIYGVRSADQLIDHVHSRLRPRRADGTFR